HPTEENAHLLATCYYRSGQVTRAMAVLSGAKRPENRYLLATCCFQQGKLTEAENALLGGENRFIDDMDAIDHVPAGAAGLYLLGRVCKRGNRPQRAVDCFVKSLEMDGFMWSAYEQLCELGANLEASRFFGAATCFTNEEYTANNGSESAECRSDASDNVEDADSLDDEGKETHDCNNNAPFSEDRSTDGSYATPEPPLLLGLATPNNATIGGTSSAAKPLAYKTPNVSNTNSDNSHPEIVVKKPRVGAPAMQRRAHHRRPLADSSEKYQANARLSFSSAAFDGSPQKLSGYMCREALEMLERLPDSQQASGWAQQQIGRTHFEMADYVKAHEVFRALHRAEPHRMEGLDLYSTTLWHLKDEVELSYLAQQATDFDKLSCEAWCVAGNCFSLQKEHDTALAFFQRAIQLDPSFTYAYTLSGHEYVANEDFEKAVNCYRHAIRTDPRHYNAWYGLGTIYYRQEKFEFA
ncbi:hypothetical protein BBJ28_00015222, partial [Nothophytophthora sp. Chile5]